MVELFVDITATTNNVLESTKNLDYVGGRWGIDLINIMLVATCKLYNSYITSPPMSQTHLYTDLISTDLAIYFQHVISPSHTEPSLPASCPIHKQV